MWIFRLQQEKKISDSSYFVTFTYDDEHLPYTDNNKYNKNRRPTLKYRDHQLFMKKLRKREKTSKLKYYAVGEYGDQFNRPHYHSILFNVTDINNIYQSWEGGRVQIDECNIKTIAYVAKYVQKQIKFKDRSDPREREKALMSKGLGQNYLTPQMQKFMKTKLNPYLTHYNGQKIALPRYYKDKVYNDKEKLIISQKSLEHIETTEQFDSFHQENEWKKDQYRQRDKTANYKRSKL